MNITAIIASIVSSNPSEEGEYPSLPEALLATAAAVGAGLVAYRTMARLTGYAQGAAHAPGQRAISPHSEAESSEAAQKARRVFAESGSSSTPLPTCEEIEKLIWPLIEPSLTWGRPSTFEGQKGKDEELQRIGAVIQYLYEHGSTDNFPEELMDSLLRYFWTPQHLESLNKIIQYMRTIPLDRLNDATDPFQCILSRQRELDLEDAYLLFQGVVQLEIRGDLATAFSPTYEISCFLNFDLPVKDHRGLLIRLEAIVKIPEKKRVDALQRTISFYEKREDASHPVSSSDWADALAAAGRTDATEWEEITRLANELAQQFPETNCLFSCLNTLSKIPKRRRQAAVRIAESLVELSKSTGTQLNTHSSLSKLLRLCASLDETTLFFIRASVSKIPNVCISDICSAITFFSSPQAESIQKLPIRERDTVIGFAVSLCSAYTKNKNIFLFMDILKRISEIPEGLGTKTGIVEILLRRDPEELSNILDTDIPLGGDEFDHLLRLVPAERAIFLSLGKETRSLLKTFDGLSQDCCLRLIADLPIEQRCEFIVQMHRLGVPKDWVDPILDVIHKLSVQRSLPILALLNELEIEARKKGANLFVAIGRAISREMGGTISVDAEIAPSLLFIFDRLFNVFSADEQREFLEIFLENGTSLRNQRELLGMALSYHPTFVRTWTASPKDHRNLVSGFMFDMLLNPKAKYDSSDYIAILCAIMERPWEDIEDVFGDFLPQIFSRMDLDKWEIFLEFISLLESQGIEKTDIGAIISAFRIVPIDYQKTWLQHIGRLKIPHGMWPEVMQSVSLVSAKDWGLYVANLNFACTHMQFVESQIAHLYFSEKQRRKAMAILCPVYSEWIPQILESAQTLDRKYWIAAISALSAEMPESTRFALLQKSPQELLTFLKQFRKIPNALKQEFLASEEAKQQNLLQQLAKVPKNLQQRFAELPVNERENFLRLWARQVARAMSSFPENMRQQLPETFLIARGLPLSESWKYLILHDIAYQQNEELHLNQLPPVAAMDRNQPKARRKAKQGMEILRLRQGVLSPEITAWAVAEFEHHLATSLETQKQDLAQMVLKGASNLRGHPPLLGEQESWDILGMPITGEEAIARIWIFTLTLPPEDVEQARESMISALAHCMDDTWCRSNPEKIERLVEEVLDGRLKGLEHHDWSGMGILVPSIA